MVADKFPIISLVNQNCPIGKILQQKVEWFYFLQHDISPPSEDSAEVNNSSCIVCVDVCYNVLPK